MLGFCIVARLSSRTSSALASMFVDIDEPEVGQAVHQVQRREVGDGGEVDAAEVEFGDAGQFADADVRRVSRRRRAQPEPSASGPCS